MPRSNGGLHISSQVFAVILPIIEARALVTELPLQLTKEQQNVSKRKPNIKKIRETLVGQELQYGDNNKSNLFLFLLAGAGVREKNA